MSIPPSKAIFAPANMRAAASNDAYQRLILTWMAEEYTLRYSGGLVPDVYHIFAKVLTSLAICCLAECSMLSTLLRSWDISQPHLIVPAIRGLQPLNASLLPQIASTHPDEISLSATMAVSKFFRHPLCYLSPMDKLHGAAFTRLRKALPPPTPPCPRRAGAFSATLSHLLPLQSCGCCTRWRRWHSLSRLQGAHRTMARDRPWTSKYWQLTRGCVWPWAPLQRYRGASLPSSTTSSFAEMGLQRRHETWEDIGISVSTALDTLSGKKTRC